MSLEKKVDSSKKDKQDSSKDDGRTYGLSRQEFEDAVQGKYLGYVKAFSTIPLQELYETTGVKPKIPEDIMQEAYHNFLERSAFGILIDAMEKVTGIKPVYSEEKINKIYMDNAQKGSIIQIRALEKITGIKPSEDVMRAYLLSK